MPDVFGRDPERLVRFQREAPFSPLNDPKSGLIDLCEHDVHFYRWTAYGRLALFPGNVAFVLLGVAPPILLAIGAFESGCGVWTGLALRREAIEST